MWCVESEQKSYLGGDRRAILIKAKATAVKKRRMYTSTKIFFFTLHS